MHLTRVLALLALLTVLITSLAVAPPVAAQAENPNTAALEQCREWDETGVLGATGYTPGACVNVLAGGETGNRNRLLAGICVSALYQERHGNTGQCVSQYREFDRGIRRTLVP